MHRSSIVLSCLLFVSTSAFAAEGLVARYLDSSSGRDVLVTGETPPATARAWLAEVAKAPNEEAIRSIHQTYAAKGLAAADADVLLARDTAITQYTASSGATIWVIGGTPVSSAAGWMKIASDAEDLEPLRKLVEENHANGLLASTIFSEGTRVTIAWGRVVAPSEVETGPEVTPDFSKMEEWMDALNAAKTEKEFVDVVRANHAKGMTTASGLRIKEGGVQMGVTVVWVSFGLLGRSKN